MTWGRTFTASVDPPGGDRSAYTALYQFYLPKLTIIIYMVSFVLRKIPRKYCRHLPEALGA
jgi:hypothetical protein